MCCFEADDEVRVFLTRETGKQISRGGTKTLGDRHRYCCIWLRPGNRRGFAGREGHSLPAALCPGGEGEGQTSPAKPLHLHTHSESLVSVCPSSREDGTEATARITRAPKRGGQCQRGALLQALKQGTLLHTYAVRWGWGQAGSWPASF